MVSILNLTFSVSYDSGKLFKKGANSRDTVLTYPEYENLQASVPAHLKAIVATAFWTGMRRGEILKLTRDKVDLVNRMIRLRPEDTKEKKAKKVPISKTLRTILMQIPGRGDNGFVFLYNGSAISSIRTGFIAGCNEAGIRYGRGRRELIKMYGWLYLVTQEMTIWISGTIQWMKVI